MRRRHSEKKRVSKSKQINEKHFNFYCCDVKEGKMKFSFYFFDERLQMSFRCTKKRKTRSPAYCQVSKECLMNTIKVLSNEFEYMNEQIFIAHCKPNDGFTNTKVPTWRSKRFVEVRTKHKRRRKTSFYDVRLSFRGSLFRHRLSDTPSRKECVGERRRMKRIHKSCCL